MGVLKVQVFYVLLFLLFPRDLVFNEITLAFASLGLGLFTLLVVIESVFLGIEF